MNGGPPCNGGRQDSQNRPSQIDKENYYMKPPDDSDDQEERGTSTVVPQLSIVLTVGIAAVTTAAVWPSSAPAVELAITILTVLLDVLRRAHDRSRSD